jgi:hypothetical protein
VKPTEPKTKRPIQILRERRGALPRELVQRHRQQRVVRRKIEKALKSAAKTVPELAAEIGEATHDVLWHVTAMKKYGKVAEAEASGSYFKYILVNGSQETEPIS